MPKTQSQTALIKIRTDILSGALSAGQKLRASHISKVMNISRTPIKEALIALEAEGLLIADKSGYSVRSFDINDVFTSIEIRGLLEALAAQKLAQIGPSKPTIARLQGLIDAMDGVIATQAYSDYDELNEAFHLTLTQASGSHLLIDEIHRSYRFSFAAPSAFPDTNQFGKHFSASLNIAQHHHRSILEAITSRDTLRAFEMTREHARLAFGNITEALAQKSKFPQLALVSA